MSDTQDHDQTTFVRSPATSASDRPTLDSVDFDVTAGFGDEAPTETGEFFDITQGADEPGLAAAGGDFLDLSGGTATAAEARAETPAAGGLATPVPPAPAPAPIAPSTTEPAPTGGGNLIVIGAVIAAIIAAVVWFALR